MKEYESARLMSIQAMMHFSFFFNAFKYYHYTLNNLFNTLRIRTIKSFFFLNKIISQFSMFNCIFDSMRFIFLIFCFVLFACIFKHFQFYFGQIAFNYFV